MFRKFIAALVASSAFFALPAHAQSAPWQTTQWVAECILDDRQTRDARVVYAPAQGVYCAFENYTSGETGAVIERVEILEEDVRNALIFAEFASTVYEDWGLIAPDLLVDAPPEDARTLPGSGEGLVMNIVPESVGDSGDVLGGLSRPGELMGHGARLRLASPVKRTTQLYSTPLRTSYFTRSNSPT